MNCVKFSHTQLTLSRTNFILDHLLYLDRGFHYDYLFDGELIIGVGDTEDATTTIVEQALECLGDLGLSDELESNLEAQETGRVENFLEYFLPLVSTRSCEHLSTCCGLDVLPRTTQQYNTYALYGSWSGAQGSGQVIRYRGRGPSCH